jgi:hypothetical protein
MAAKGDTAEELANPPVSDVWVESQYVSIT